MSKDTRIQVRFEADTVKKLKRLAATSHRSISGEICYLVEDIINNASTYPKILKSGNQYIWISPVGVYGDLNKIIWQRFLKGGLPMNGEKWSEEFEDFQEASESMGEEVCRYSPGGLIVTDIEQFIVLTKQFE